MKVWAGNGEEPWRVEIEHDCFSLGEGFVVSIEAVNLAEEESALVTPSAKQAREMARALTESAAAVDKANARGVAEGPEFQEAVKPAGAEGEGHHPRQST